MDPFRVYLKVKLKEGQFEEFLALIPPFIEIIKQSEPDTLQFEAFFNGDNLEIVWLQSYENVNIQSIVRVNLTDLEAYRNIFEQVETAASIQPGVAFHRSYQIDDNNIVAFEEYANEKAVLDWVEVFAKNSGDFGSLVKSMSYQVFGNPTGKCKETLDAWGAIFNTKVAGFTRFN